MRFLSPLLTLALLWFVFLVLPAQRDGVAAGTALRMEVADLTRRADLVVEARVLSERVLAVEERIETELALGVERTFRGPDLPLRTIRIPGGVLPDGSGMLLAGMPRIRAGEQVLLFLSTETAGGVRMPIGLSQGKLQVVFDAQGRKLLVRDVAGLALVGPGSEPPLHAGGRVVREYGAVVAEIEAALAAAERAR
jgi:hypothetical protein